MGVPLLGYHQYRLFPLLASLLNNSVALLHLILERAVVRGLVSP
jgi:hypothetical protein